MFVDSMLTSIQKILKLPLSFQVIRLEWLYKI